MSHFAIGRNMSRAAVLLDRDGTLIVERHYLGDPAQVELERDAAEGLRQLARLGFALVVVTNQSGIARGLFPPEAARAVNGRVDELLAAEGVVIDRWFMCPHGPNDGCDCRKPLPGMALAAAADLDLDLTRSFVIGDRRSDLQVAFAVGARGILVTTGKGNDERPWAEAAGSPVCHSLLEAAATIELACKRSR